MRRRGAELERAVLDAATAELLESGYRALTMERVAKRAGTNKNALYRRWPHRAALAAAAYRALVADTTRTPDTGDLRADVLALLRGLAADLASPRGEVLTGMVAGIAAEAPELLAELRELGAQAGSGVWLTVLGRAVARGEARPEALLPRVAGLPLVLLRNEFLTGGPPTDEALVEIVDQVYLPLVRVR
ncbi:TetR/AcrR family transcriptional regulator [Actinosynnema mirum]|uniref:Regulatory protein TetR n=1 Tax=Actinosynnema mirum (strain ATCC 29888 / DSM 43827 / JCM 3225 / NBRC 14064 / NCIMB 13271 / NRRL B-12336 / IMRU 3971 / 101) TaxID=446462 RepID=C6WI37_ACTMD|nr:TetR/AcrR family transcriptional regulator [Actinosynnema mirum]ACU34488.1 regulatory protein TetR [Actinosynnema mirum DSM 43827]